MALEKFHYTVGKKKLTLPRFGELPFGVARKIRKVSEEEQLFILLEEAADEASLEIIDTIPMSEIEKLMQAWMKDSGVTAGE